MTVNAESTIEGLAYLLMKAIRRYWSLKQNYQPSELVKYKISKERDGFQNNQYHKLQNTPKVITGCWISDYDMILSSNGKNSTIICISSWTHRTTSCELAQSRQIERLLSYCKQIPSSEDMTTRLMKVTTVQFWSASRPHATVWNS